jgi:transcriptional regulator with XRE-family HTH domain
MGKFDRAARELRAARVALGAQHAKASTISEMARRLGVSRQSVLGWESGDSRPDEARWEDLEQAYGLAAGTLANLYSDPRVNLGYWYGRAQSIERQIALLLAAQQDFVGEMAAYNAGSGDAGRDDPSGTASVKKTVVAHATQRATTPAETPRPSAPRRRRAADAG